jgi:hypothetical protein
MFEMINEPYPMSSENVTTLNAQVLKLIRRTNPTRIVLFSGYMWSNSDQLVTAAIPDSSDHYLMGYYHSYDPYPFGLIGTGTYGTASDINATKAKFDQVTSWSTRNNIPVVLGEFGYIDTAGYNSRMCAYGTVVDQALTHHVPAFAWDDGGDFPIYNRYTYGFNEVKDILIHVSPESPNGLKISQAPNHSIMLQWHNRNPENDSIVVERRLRNGSYDAIGKVSSTDSVFIDSTTSAGMSYYFRLSIIKQDSVEIQSYPIMVTVSTTSVGLATVPNQFRLFNNYPNPFNPSTTIRFDVPQRSRVRLTIYNILGQQVAELANEEMSAGFYDRTWNAKVASGMYLYRIDATAVENLNKHFVDVKKMILLK